MHFHVEWTISAEWIVEANSKEALLRAAKGVSDNDLDWSEPIISVHLLQQERVRPDAVLINGAFLAPEDAEVHRYLEALKALDEDQKYECPHCHQTSRLGDAFGICEHERIDMRCPNPRCYRKWELEDVAPPKPIDDARQLPIFVEGECDDSAK